MGDFDLIENDFNVADETINFGTRCVAHGDNLHQAATLAVLKCSEQESSFAHISCKAQNGFIFCSINKCLKVFKDKQCSEIIFNCPFDDIIDTFTFSRNGKYLLICLRNGTIHLIECTAYKFLQNASILNDLIFVGGVFFVNSFFETTDNDILTFLVITAKGQLFRVTFNETTNKILSNSLHEFNFLIRNSTFNSPFLFVNGSKVGVLNLDTEKVTLDDESLELSSLDDNFLALESDGNLLLICPYTLFICQSVDFRTSCKNFIAIPNEINRVSQIVAVTNENNADSLSLLSYPDFSPIYSLPVSEEVCLIPPESIYDELLFISKTYEKNIISTIRLLCVYETDPEQRLHRLLKKKQYEEAERFAKNFNLNPNIISKAKAKVIVDKPICDSEDIENLINILDTIDDEEFILDSCQNVEPFCAKTADVKKILDYGRKISLKSRQVDAIANFETSQTILEITLLRFETFYAIYRGTFNDNIKFWSSFRDCNLIEELKEYLRNQKIEGANIIYTRLGKITIDNLTNDDIKDILRILNNHSIDLYKPFLPNFLRITLAYLPDSSPSIIEWIYNKVFHFEKNCNCNFPDNAIEFYQDILDIILRINRFYPNTKNPIINQTFADEVGSILSTLSHVKRLKDEYNICIPVSTYSGGPQSVVRALLNMTMSCEKYEMFINGFLLGYMRENHMEADEIFLEEITEVMKSSEEYWICIVGAILNCISCTELKLTAVTEILRMASVPWSETVKKIANDALQYYDPLVEDIQQLIAYEPLKTVLNEPLYKIKLKEIHRISDLKFVVDRIIYCNDENMIENIYKLTINKSAKFKHEATILLLANFIEKEEFSKALEMIDNNPLQERIELCKRLAVIIEDHANTTIDSKEQKNYLAMLTPIFSRLTDLTTDSFQKSNFTHTFELIRNKCKLETNLSLTTSTPAMRGKINRKELIAQLIESTRVKFQVNEITPSEILQQMKTFATCLSIDENDILIALCNECKDFNLIYATALHILNTGTSSKDLCLITVLILKYIGTFSSEAVNISDSDLSLSIHEESFECAEDAFLLSLQLVGDLVSKALLLAGENEICQVASVLLWIVPTSSNCSRNNQEIFSERTTLSKTPPGPLTFRAIRKIFTVFCRYISTFDYLPEFEYFTHFRDEHLSDDEVISELSQFNSCIDELCQDSQQFTAFSLIQAFKNSLICIPNFNEKIVKALNNILKKKCFPKLQQLVINSSQINSDLLYELLLSTNTNDYLNFIQTDVRIYRTQLDKFHSLLVTGCKLMDHLKDDANKISFLNLLVSLKWWRKYENTNKLHYDTFFELTALKRFELLTDIGCMDFEAITDFCVDFKLDSKICYVIYFKRLFSNWKPDYEIKTDLNGLKYVVVKNDEKLLLNKCSKLMDVLSSNTIYDIITSLWRSVNFYYHEIFMTMLSILKKINPAQDNVKNISMLNFLKSYKRVNKPNETEIEEWFSIFPDTQSVSELAEFRLPFTTTLFTQKIFSIIRPEINLKTYKTWFKILNFAGEYLSKDEICSYAVKELVASGFLVGKKDSVEWSLSPKLDHLLFEVNDCVENISSLEIATSVFYHLMINIPPGADRVNAAKFSYQYGKAYIKADPIAAREPFNKIEKKYFTLSAMHILHQHKLVEEKYIDLVSQPKTLIVSLYNDERIVKKCDFVDISCPDINQAAKDLATLFDLSIREIRLMLINNLISHYQTSTINLDAIADDSSSETKLKRASYICKSDDLEFFQEYLFQFGTEDDFPEERNAIVRANSLKLLVMIADVKKIESIFDILYVELIDFTNKLLIIGNLQLVDTELGVTELDKTDKKDLLNRLSQKKTALSIKTMAMVSMTFNLKDLKYWKYIIRSAIKFNLFVELKSYMDFVQINSKWQNKSFYIEAWQKLIDNAFASLNSVDDCDLNTTLINNFFMIQSCPVLYSINFEYAFSKCLDIRKVEFAALFLQFIEKEEFVQKILQTSNFDKSFLLLDHLKNQGVWGVDMVKRILLMKKKC